MASPVADFYGCNSGGVIAAGRSVKTILQLAAEVLLPGTQSVVTQASINSAGANGTLPWMKTNAAPSSLDLLDWANGMPWDSVKKRAYACGGRDYAYALNVKMVTFDAKADTWDSTIDPWNGATNGGHLWNMFDLASQHELMLYVSYGNAKISVWDTVSKTPQASIPVPPTGGYGGFDPVTAIAWHPTLGAQGSIVWMNLTRKRIMRYDWLTSTWSELKIDGVSGADDAMIACYLSGPEVVLIGNSHNYATAPFPAFNIIDNTGAWSTTPPAPAQLSCNGSSARGPLVAHPDGNSAIAFSLDDGHMYQWVAASNTWVDRGLTPTGLNTQYSIACTIPEYGVIMFVQATSAGAPFYVRIYKPDY